MKRIKLISSALALMLAGSVGGIMAWNLVTATGRAQDADDVFGEGFDDFGGFGGQENEPEEPCQVWCEVMFIQIDTADLDEIMARDGALITSTGEKAILTAQEKSELLRLLKQRQSFEFIGTASVISVSGQQALVQMVEEIRYPTEYDAVPLEETVPQDEDVVLYGYGGPPGMFDEREAGTRLNVTPTVSSKEDLITLVILPEASRLVGWRNVGGMGEDQPTFLAWNVVTTIYLRDATTCVMTGALTNPFGESAAMNPGKPPDKMGKKSAITLVSARILGLPANRAEEDAE